MKTKNYESNHASEILLNLNKERKLEENFCDITIEAGSRKFLAHRNVVASFSLFFKKLLTIEMKEKYEKRVVLQDVDEESFDAILNFIYTCQITISSDSVYNILQAANFMDICRLKEYCEAFLCDDVNKQNCFDILKYANLYEMEALHMKIQDILKNEFESIINEEEFNEMEFEEVFKLMQTKDRKCFLLRSINLSIAYNFTLSVLFIRDFKTDHLWLQQVSSEECVFHSLMRWIKHDVSARTKHLVELFKLIELEDLSGDFLASVVSIEDLIFDSHECTKIVLKLIASRLKAAKQDDPKHDSIEEILPLESLTLKDVGNTLGMEDGRIKNFQITASTWYRDFFPYNARLNGESAWAFSIYKPKGQFLRVDLLQETRVIGVITQGHPDCRWITKYKACYGMPDQSLQCIKKNGQDETFQGNSDGNSHVTNIFPTPITARYFQLIVEDFVVKGYAGWPIAAIRLEFLTS